MLSCPEEQDQSSDPERLAPNQVRSRDMHEPRVCGGTRLALGSMTIGPSFARHRMRGSCTFKAVSLILANLWIQEVATCI